jgi:arabinose-5-phosphate isomerase
MPASLPAEEILHSAQAAIQNESQVVAAVADQLGSSFVAATELMLDCQGHVLVAGAGTSHSVAARFAHLLSCCGTPALFIHPGDSQHGLSGAVTERDVLFAISKGGETVEVNHLARIAKSRGAAVIGLTENSESTLAKLSDIVLCFKAPPDSDAFGMIAMGSSLFNAALCDAFCWVLLKIRGYTKQAFGETHPGGAVGLKLAENRTSNSLEMNG